MQNKPLISVIIPVYNVEQYLDKCVSSLLEYNGNDVEYIFVDDQSTDNSLRILESIKDTRVKVYTKKNSGLFQTWKYGVSKTSGKYVVFVDSDDYINPSLFDFLKEQINSFNYDLIVYGLCYVEKDRQYLFDFFIKDGAYINEDYENIKDALISTFDSNSILSSRCNKAFKLSKLKAFLDKYPLYRIDFLEDNSVVFPFCRFINSMYVSHTPYYFYIKRNDSISIHSSVSSLMSNYNDCVVLNKYLSTKEFGFSQKALDDIYFKCFFNLLVKSLDARLYLFSKLVLKDQRFHRLLKQEKRLNFVQKQLLLLRLLRTYAFLKKLHSKTKR